MLQLLPACVARLVFKHLGIRDCLLTGLVCWSFRNSRVVINHFVELVDWPRAFQPAFVALVRRFAGRCQLCLERVRKPSATPFSLRCHMRCIRPYLVPTRRLTIKPDDHIFESKHSFRRIDPMDPVDAKFRSRLRRLSVPCGTVFSGWRWYYGALFWDRSMESEKSARLGEIIPAPKRQRMCVQVA
jgi:hypothetical protein